MSPASSPARFRSGSHNHVVALARHRDEKGTITFDQLKLDTISGMAPKCKLLSLKVLDAEGQGTASNLIAAIATIQKMNGYGRRLQVHGVNMSVGYDFEPEWFACGQSPLCVEVNRLVRSGVVVVVAAGNTGYGFAQSAFRGTIAAGMGLTINDPGNAELAITVGATHRDSPHIYGVSYFSSKGPTGDGRLKPDVVAPGEKILSCAAGKMKATARGGGERGARGQGGRRALEGREVPVRRGQRHEHGRASRVGDRGRVPVDPQGIHRPARGGQADHPVERDGPEARSVFSGQRPRRSDARDPVGVTAGLEACTTSRAG